MFLALKRLLVLGRDFLIYAARFSLSPNNFNGSNANVRGVYDDGLASSIGVYDSNGVRPVLNLKAGSLTKGLGTATDPYIVE